MRNKSKGIALALIFVIKYIIIGIFNIIASWRVLWKNIKRNPVITKDLSRWSSNAAFARFKSFCDNVLGTKVDEVPTEQSIFMRRVFP